MPLIKTNKQKDNLSKYSYDISKIILAISVISPIAKPESFNPSLFAGGFVVTMLLFTFAYLLDSREVNS